MCNYCIRITAFMSELFATRPSRDNTTSYNLYLIIILYNTVYVSCRTGPVIYILYVNFPVPMSLPSIVHFHEGSDMAICTMSFNCRTGGSRAPRRAGKIVGGGDAIGECLGNLFFRLWQQLAVYYLWKNLLELCDRNHTLGNSLRPRR